MFKTKFAALLAALILAPFALTACNNSANAGPTTTNGIYKADGFEATVSDNAIQVDIVDGDTSSLYWKGTFPSTGENVTSDGDVEAMSGSMLGSQDKTKTFTIKDDELSFKFSMMGTTKTIKLKKV